MMIPATSDIALALNGVSVIRDGRPILSNVAWTVRKSEHWILLGPNGSGKTTICEVASLYLHPSTGTVEVLGETLGFTDVRTLRTRIGYSSAKLADLIRPGLSITDVVVTAKHGALAPWWHTYTTADYEKAVGLLTRVGCKHLLDRRYGTLASGERKRVELARALMADPGMLLLDEPTAGLDLGGREALIASLGSLAEKDTTPPTILVTHHVDEIPPGFSHLLLLRGGGVQAAGPINTTLTDEALSQCFELPLHVERRNQRWQAWAI